MGGNEITKNGREYVGYDYKTINASSEKMPMLLDSYANFGWTPNDAIPDMQHGEIVAVSLKRERNILNKAELTRLQQHFEACMDMIEKLENSRMNKAVIYSLTTGVVGTAFLAASVFMITSQPPMILYCVLLGAPGLICWAAAYPIFRFIREKRVAETVQIIDDKYEEMHETCAKGSALVKK